MNIKHTTRNIAFIFFFYIGMTTNAQEAIDSTFSTNEKAKLRYNKPKSDSILDFASKHIGKPYRSGGKGPHSFDCSGYTGYIFSYFGYTLNASSSSQYQQGEKLNFDEIRRGDLVFFKGRNSQSSRIGHVGIVCDIDTGNKSFKFIHAAVNGGIKIDMYPDGYYYSKRYVGAKRIIESPQEMDLITDDFKEIVAESIKEEIIEEEKKYQIYIVKKGDNLFRISKKYNCTINEIKEWNNLKNNKLSTGKKLTIKGTIRNSK